MTRPLSFVLILAVLTAVFHVTAQTAEAQVAVRKTANNTRITIESTGPNGVFAFVTNSSVGIRVRTVSAGVTESFSFACPSSGQQRR